MLKLLREGQDWEVFSGNEHRGKTHMKKNINLLKIWERGAQGLHREGFAATEPPCKGVAAVLSGVFETQDLGKEEHRAYWKPDIQAAGAQHLKGIASKDF